MPNPALVVFCGGFGPSPAERLVDGARIAAAQDAIDAWAGDAVLVTDGDSALTGATGATIDADAGAFHFGRRLAGVLRRHAVDSAVYIGAGSVPLFTANELRAAASAITPERVVTNNFFSSDIIGFPVNERVLAVVEGVERDNALARALKERAGLEVDVLPRTVATQFDIDTPADVAVLALVVGGGCRLREHVAGADIDTSRYQATLPFFLDPAKEIVVAGRVGTHAWQYLERETACRVRLFAEERGMDADGRAAAGSARSLLGFYIEAAGIGRFFAALAELGGAAFIDTRVLLAHRRIEASREDRFLSDLSRWEEIGEPFLREFTRAAAEAPLPVLLGGHSLMAGGLMALNEYAWAQRDAGRM